MLEEGQNQRIKFAEIMENGEEDRISALSDCLLLEILCRLPSTKDAIRTGTLSKRWEHLWTWVPTLIFRNYAQYFKNRSDFGLLVDKTLSQCRQLKLKKFEVHTFYDIRFESQLRNWIRFAVSCKVEELNLGFWREKGEFVLDQFLFINSCFTDLTLAECKLNPTGAISWPNLRSLCICRVHLDEDLFVKILSGSPLLETLVLEYCKWPLIPSKSEFDMTEISDPTSLSLTQCRQPKHLKKFKMSNKYDTEFHPQISRLICYAIRCNVKELSVEFRDTECGYEFMIDQILFTGSCITELTLQGCKLNPVGAISWKGLRFLCISRVHLDEDLIENILSGSPVLETLELNRCYGFRRLDITSKSVKNLVLSEFEYPYRKHAIEINAPHILSITIQSGTFPCKPLLLNVSSLVKAYLNYTCTTYEHCKETLKQAEQEMLKEFIMNLGHVKELELGSSCAKALSCLEDQGFISPSNVKVAGIITSILGIVTAVNEHIIETTPTNQSQMHTRPLEPSSFPYSLFLTLMKDLETLVEVVAQHFYGDDNKWNFIAVTEATKVLARLALLRNSGYKMLLHGGETANDENSTNDANQQDMRGRLLQQGQNGHFTPQGRALSAMSRFGENARMLSQSVGSNIINVQL